MRVKRLDASLFFPLLCGLAWLFQSTVVAVGAEGETLDAKLLPLVRAHQGQVAVAVKHLKTGVTFEYRVDAPMPTASLIKFPVMIEGYRQAPEGKLDLEKQITLKAEDKVPGTGI